MVQVGTLAVSNNCSRSLKFSAQGVAHGPSTHLWPMEDQTWLRGKWGLAGTWSSPCHCRMILSFLCLSFLLHVYVNPSWPWSVQATEIIRKGTIVLTWKNQTWSGHTYLQPNDQDEALRSRHELHGQEKTPVSDITMKVHKLLHFRISLITSLILEPQEGPPAGVDHQRKIAAWIYLLLDFPFAFWPPLCKGGRDGEEASQVLSARARKEDKGWSLCQSRKEKERKGKEEKRGIERSPCSVKRWILMGDNIV